MLQCRHYIPRSLINKELMNEPGSVSLTDSHMYGWEFYTEFLTKRFEDLIYSFSRHPDVGPLDLNHIRKYEML